MMNQQKLLAAILCAAAPFAYAADNDALDDVVVTATRIAQPLKQTLSSTTVITQEDIKNSQAPDAATILRSVAGVEIAQSGGQGKTTSLFLRGNSDKQVLVLIDGVRANSASTGTTSIQDLMLDQIERIEIVRGNVSSVYGSEAIGGVVQIFTKKGRGAPHLNASAGAGSLGTQRLAAGLGGAVNNTSFSLQASSYKTDGVSALNPALYPKANPDADGYRNNSISANVRHTFNQDHSLSASLFNSHGENQYDSSYGLPTDEHSNTQKLAKASLASDNRLTDNWQSHLQYAQGVDDYQNYLNGSANALYRTTSKQLTWENTLQLNSMGQMLLGAETLTQNLDSLVAYTVTQRTVTSLFAGYTGSYGAHQLQTNLRQDDYTQFGTANTGLLGYGYAINDDWRATTSYSTAFRAPTFNELYYPGYGNALIQPERSRNMEAGLHYAAGAQLLDIVYFNNVIQDFIDSTPKNVGEARIDGTELSYAGKFDNTGVNIALTSQHPRDGATGNALIRRAQFHSSVAVSHHVGAWLLGGEWLNSGERTDGTHTLPSYDVFNLTAAYALNKELKLGLRADNLTDQNDAMVYGYNPLGRTLFFSLSYQQ